MNFDTKQNRAEYVREMKEHAPCNDCGCHFEPRTMSFVRPNHETAPKWVSQLVQDGPWEALLHEIEQSILLCRSCFSQRIGWGHEWQGGRSRVSKRMPEQKNARKRKPKQDARRNAIAAIKDKAPCARCGIKLGSKRMWLVRNQDRWIDGYTKSVSRSISDSLSEEQLLAAMYGSDFVCKECFDAQMAEWCPTWEIREAADVAGT